MDSKIKNLNVIILALCIIVETGCATLSYRKETDDFFYRTGEIIDERCRYWTTFEAQFSLKLKPSAVSGRYFLYCHKDHDLLRLDLTSFWGNSLAVMIIRGNESFLWIPSHKTVYKSQDPDNFLEKIAGIEGRITDILALTTGCFSYSQNRSFKILRSQLLPPTLSDLTVNRSDNVWKITYTPPFILTPVETIPKVIIINSSNTELNIEIKKMEKRPEIPYTIFDLSYPSETSVKEL